MPRKYTRGGTKLPAGCRKLARAENDRKLKRRQWPFHVSEFHTGRPPRRSPRTAKRDKDPRYALGAGARGAAAAPR